MPCCTDPLEGRSSGVFREITNSSGGGSGPALGGGGGGGGLAFADSGAGFDGSGPPPSASLRSAAAGVSMEAVDCNRTEGTYDAQWKQQFEWSRVREKPLALCVCSVWSSWR